MEIGCYSMDLYCDSESEELEHKYEFPHQFTGETRNDCAKRARRYGWLFKKSGETICPKCSNKKESKNV